MLGFLKSIFGGRSAAPQGNVGLAIPRTVYSPQPRSASHRTSKTPPQRPAQKPAPVPESAPVPAPAAESDGTLGSDIDISLQSVLKGLPADLQDRVRDLDIRGATMTISLERILAQLPSGSVKISFGSLRHAAPQLFSAGADFDSRDVTLPIDEILAKVNPAMICRPQAQPAQRFDAPTPQRQSSVESDAPVPVVPAPPPGQRASSLSVPPISAPGETNDSSARAASGPSDSAPEPIAPTTSRRLTPKQAKKAAARASAAQPAKSQEPRKSEEQAKSTEAGPSINVTLSSLTGAWPAELRQEIANWNLSEPKIALPADAVREGMKRGRIAFPWKTLRSWITPQPPEGASPHDAATLELPLAVITPLFLGGKKQTAKSDHTASAPKSSREEIPDLFFDARKAEQSTAENGHAVEPIASQPDATAAQNAAQPPQPAADQAVMRIPLKELTGLWPENVRAEVAHWNFDQLMVALPAERINAALKQGKVIFAWETLRSWILPAPPSATSLQDKALLELPLPVIMPLFLAARKQSSKPVAKPQPQIADDIPDPFADFLPSAGTGQQHNESPKIRVAPTANSARAATESKKNTGAAASPAVEKSSKTDLVARQQASAAKSAPVPQKVEAEPVQPENPAEQSKSPTPAEVLAAVVKLDGVAGALIALPDGFKVASKLPPGLDGDALAAFLPHIFSKVNQSTRELRMGDLNNLNFTVDNVPWKIFRVNQIFFAALGHAGKPMPTNDLSALAQRLTFKN